MPLEKSPENLKTCQICKNVFKTADPLGFHVIINHNIKYKDYYDKFYKIEVVKKQHLKTENIINIVL